MMSNRVNKAIARIDREKLKMDKEKGQSTILYELLKQSGQFFSDPTGQSFYAINKIPIPLNSEKFSNHLSGLHYSEFGIVPGTETINQVKGIGKYEASKTVKDLGVRVSHGLSGDFVYDPIDPEGKLIHIDLSGISMELPEEPLTLRYKGMMSSEITEGNKEDLESLISLWNLSENQRILLSGYVGASFIPDISHAILVIIGTHGSGKTTLTETVKTIADPNAVPIQSLPQSERDLSIAALHTWAVAFDNVNSEMKPYISDALCRIATGQGFRARALFTDSEELIIKLKRIIIVNAINEPNYAPDFLDRALVLNLQPIKDSRKTDSQINGSLNAMIPKVRGYLLSLIPEAMKAYPLVESQYKGKLPRMADFVAWAESITRAMGYREGAFFDAYIDAQDQETRRAAQSDTLIQTMELLFSDVVEISDNKFEGTTSDLLEKLTRVASDSIKKKLPKDVRQLGRELKALEPTLNSLGFTIEEDNSDKNVRKKVIKWVRKEGDHE